MPNKNKLFERLHCLQEKVKLPIGKWFILDFSATYGGYSLQIMKIKDASCLKVISGNNRLSNKEMVAFINGYLTALKKN